MKGVFMKTKLAPSHSFLRAILCCVMLSPGLLLQPTFAGVITTTNTTDILNAIGVPHGTTATYSGDTAAVGYSTAPLANFPLGSSTSFGILSSGKAGDVSLPNTSGFQGTDLGVFGAEGDTTTLTVNLKIPTSPQRAAAVGFDFTFLSEEYPEFVGSSYNDYFKATLDGKNIALDTSGKEINVNNNFFNSGLTAKGTMFDGQTPPLSIRAALPKTGTSATLALSVGDVGDGAYDSAAFIQGIKYFFPQRLYLDFDAGQAQIKIGDIEASYTKKSADLSADQKATVVNQVQSIFSPFLIEVSSEKPTSGDFSTIYIGGTTGDLPEDAKKLAPKGLLGIASKINFGNDDPKDYAVVFSGESSFNKLLFGIFGKNLEMISQTVAHEAGHILGLLHVLPNSELLYPYGSESNTSISDVDVKRAEIDQVTKKVTPTGTTQNSYQELARNVGLADKALIIDEPSLWEKLKKKVKVIFGSLFSTVYDAQIAILLSDDAFPNFYALGDILDGSIVELDLPFDSSFGAFLIGSSTPGGAKNIFGTTNLIANIDPALINIEDLLSPFSGPLVFSLFESDGVGFEQIGNVSLELQNASSVPEPNTLLLLCIALFAIVSTRYKPTVVAFRLG